MKFYSPLVYAFGRTCVMKSRHSGEVRMAIRGVVRAGVKVGDGGGSGSSSGGGGGGGTEAVTKEGAV